MTFNPLQERGIPLDKQLRNWRELNVTPIDPDHADPYTRCRIIAMNGIEVEATLFSHHLARYCPSIEVDLALALSEDRRRDIVRTTKDGLEAARRRGRVGGTDC
jgi:hypothetical protein